MQRSYFIRPPKRYANAITTASKRRFFYVYSLIFLIELIATLTTLVYYAADIPSCLLPLPVWTLTVCLLVSWISVPRIPPEPPHVKPTAYFVTDTSVDPSPTLFLLLLLLVPRIQAEATESNQLG